MFARFHFEGDTVRVRLVGRPVSDADFHAFLADWLACYQRPGTRPFVFVVDATALAWSVVDVGYLVRLHTFVGDLHASRTAYPQTYDRLRRCYVVTQDTCVRWALRLLCAWQPPVAPTYLVDTVTRAQDVEALMGLGIPINHGTAPDVVGIG